jgi:5-formaminoimidazole-4-carboxamide-1-beta-D-ribofuranosyl 5'-monophosphate synthetase
MKKISLVLEVSMEDAKYDEVIKWGVEPSDHVTTIIAEPLREKGFVVNAYGVETEHTMYDRLKKHQDHLIQADAYNDLEQEIISRACVGGVCED